MAAATNTTASSSQIFCECGDNHRTAGSRGCPLFEIINCLTKEIEEFLEVQEILKFGEDGLMEKPLRDVMRSKFTKTMGIFIEYEQLVEKNPEWCLDEEVSRLRKYFSDVAKGCSGDKGPATLQKPLRDLTHQVDGDSQSLRSVKSTILIFWSRCDDIISQYARSGAVPVSCTSDPEGYLSKVDNGFKRSLQAILSLPDTEEIAFQALMKGTYEIWTESRRLLCDFKRPPKKVILRGW